MNTSRLVAPRTKVPTPNRALNICALLLALLIAGCRQTAAAPTSTLPVSTAPTSPPPAATTTTNAPPTAAATAEPGAEPAGDIPAYQNLELPVDERVEDLLSRMTLAEKIGQMTLVEKNSVRRNDVTEKFIGAVLSGGGGYPPNNTPEGWAEMVNGFQEQALATRLAIPLLYGVDAVHGHNNLRGATIFPHNIGLGATGNPELLEQIGRATALETTATGIRWNYAPVVAVPQDIRWGRTYEAYSENPELVAQLATAFIGGLQGENLGDPQAMLATAKHFVGDGGTAWGSSTNGSYSLDQGDTRVDEATLRAIHLPPYLAAIEAGAQSIMVSFSSWNGVKMHGHSYLLSDVLKGELGFSGFLVSDWQGIDQVSPDYYQAVVTAVNAGVDMNMVPYDYDRFINTMLAAVEAGDISEARIDDAVRRILAVKFALGLFEQPFPDPAYLALVGSDENRQLAREAVSQSLVLLKNDNQTLPLARDTPLILVGGQAADDIGLQSGGWTIEWQGRPGNVTDGVTILEAIEATASGEVLFNRFARFEELDQTAGVGIVVLAKQPYAEGVGDAADLALPASDVALIEQMGSYSERVVVILLSGRPLIITEQLPLAEAWIAAWLPGSEGQGIADNLFGDHSFTGKLSFTWPRSMAQVPLDLAALAAGGCEAPLFPFGYGLDASETEPLVIPDC
ncbi:MAG: glycoside hydrolase family 3 C-terminal domain-containing protein [Chloroflexi bacterium]|nr:glycoside hydrolase family 3 C-terminal domain-containing protein [Chloroflexota bacterium]MCI0576860.1 glycoside hydrolase family 3 C-terminal domain-containing protein [Chloroflexota bacterium]MCI0645118.1 glycoside hydrolase family 3 C-terminal domain-containing protein [Chloroflexota bacterium]MCI0730166.1 glycoside hydrolase family 3 C-terminal domain-containing protein [Chloroflexota bacterium]